MPQASQPVEHAYQLARERYAQRGVDTQSAISRLAGVAVSVHCWQGDDVRGFEDGGAELGGGLAVTGSHPGRARNAAELRADLEQAFRLIPGNHRVNLHASYAETQGQRVERNELEPEHFQGWMQWAGEHSLALDFNPTFFAHDLAADGFTLAHRDAGVRHFWIEHGVACRRIASAMGQSQGSPCVNNVWIPDGFKDTPVDRAAPRRRLVESLDAIFAQPADARWLRDAVECKLFGIGSESYVVGSHEFYLGYALTRKKLLCLDSGHFHPTEVISDKITAVLLWLDELLLHVSRGVRWDSDHIVTFTDELQAMAQELVRGELLSRVRIGLDFFDASVNRVAAWTVGTRALLQALLLAMLEPLEALRQAENSGDYTTRLALLEEQKTLPWAAVWDYYCETAGVPVGAAWLADIQRYERDVLLARG